MIFLGITFPPSFQRYLRPIPTQLQFPRPSWTSYWTPQPTGHQKHGAVSSALLQEGSSPLDSENIFRRPQTLLFILYTLHRYQPLPTIRTLTVLLHSPLGRSRPLSTVHQDISVSSPQCSDLPDLRDRSSLPYLKRVQAGISRCKGQKGSPTKQRLPVTAEVLQRVLRVLTSPDRKERTVVWAIAVTAFFGFFRLGELLPDTGSTFDPKTDVAWGDLAVDRHTDTRTVKIHLKKSKCDQFGKGVDVYLGRTDLDLCPVTATSRRGVQGWDHCSWTPHKLASPNRGS